MSYLSRRMIFTTAPWRKWQDRPLNHMIEVIEQATDIAVYICECSESMILYKVGPDYLPTVRVITNVPIYVCKCFPECQIVYCSCIK